MQKSWVDCSKKKPSSERLLLVALPDRDTATPAHWFEDEQEWVTYIEHVIIYPSMWRDLPAHPFAAI